MTFPEELRYSKNDEWVKMLDDTTALVGITDYAQHELGGLVFINLPVVGDSVTKETPMCDVESVKAVSGDRRDRRGQRRADGRPRAVE